MRGYALGNGWVEVKAHEAKTVRITRSHAAALGLVPSDDQDGKRPHNTEVGNTRADPPPSGEQTPEMGPNEGQSGEEGQRTGAERYGNRRIRVHA
jgi:hypothetical protein